jgi:hypothetical protein
MQATSKIQTEDNFRVLFVDDDVGRRTLARHYFPNLVVCTNVDTCKELMHLNSWDLVSLDFTYEESGADRLEEGAPGGMELAAWVAEFMPRVGQFRIHAYATPGSSRMAHVLMAAGYPVTWMPWGEPEPRVILDV